MPGNSLIGNLAVTLGLNTAAFERGATRAEARAKGLQGRLAGIGASIKNFGAGLVAGLGVAALAGMAKSAFEVASAMDESAQKMGVTVEAFQRLNLAATQNGISQESLAGAMAKLNKNVGLLAEGSPQAVKAFEKIGITFDDLRGKAPEQQLGIIADALNRLPSVQERVAVGAQIMGRGFSELLPLINGGSEGLAKYAAASQHQGEITTEEAKKLDELSDSWDRLKIRVGVFTAKIIAMFAELASKLDESLAKWYAWRDGIINTISSMASGAVSAVNNMVTGIGQAITGRLNAVWDGAKAKIDSVKQKFHDMYDAVVGHSYVPDMVKGIGDSISQLQKLMVDPATTATEKVSGAFQQMSSIVSSLFGQKAGGLLSAIGGIVSALAPLFGGSGIANPGIGGASVGVNANVLGHMSGGSFPRIPHFARGGAGFFGGFGGVDKNVLSLNGSPIARVSRGESFRVGSNEQAMAKVLIVPTPYFDAHVQGQAAAVAAPMAGQAAIMGAAGGVSSLQKRASRTLP